VKNKLVETVFVNSVTCSFDGNYTKALLCNLGLSWSVVLTALRVYCCFVVKRIASTNLDTEARWTAPQLENIP